MSSRGPESHHPVGYYGDPSEQKAKAKNHEGSEQNVFLWWFRDHRQYVPAAILAVALIGLAGVYGRNAFYTALEQQNVSSFAEQVRGKLTDEIPLEPNEWFYPEIMLVPAQELNPQTMTMEPTKGSINVRRVPFTTYPVTGRDTEIVGTAPQGSTVRNTLSTKGIAPHGATPGNWVAALCIDYEDLILNPDNQGIKNDPTAVCTVTELYAKAIPPGTEPGKQPASTPSIVPTPQNKPEQSK